MTTSYLPYEPQQQMLLPAGAAGVAARRAPGLLHQRHGRCAGSERVSRPLCRGGPRNQPFHPAMMVKVLVYGYATGVFSSRKMARKLHEDVAFRVLAAGNFPAHRTICDFRALHLKELSRSVRAGGEAGARDGAGQAGHHRGRRHQDQGQRRRHKAMSYERMQQGRGRAEGADRCAAGKRARQPTRPRRTSRSWTFRPRSRGARIGWQCHRRGTRTAGAAPARSGHRTRAQRRRRPQAARPGRQAKEGGRYKREFGVPKPTRRRRTSPTRTAAS